MKSPLKSSLLALALLATAAPAMAGFDILACSTKEKTAVTPTDPLNCEWKNGLMDATLAQLYTQGWRLIDAEFFNGDREVLYLERPEATAAAAPAAP